MPHEKRPDCDDGGPIVTTVPISIGYLCGHGHFCFIADEEELGQCGSKSLGEVIVHLDADTFNAGGEDAFEDAQRQLGEIISAWRSS